MSRFSVFTKGIVWKVAWLIPALVPRGGLDAQIVESRNGSIWIIQVDGTASQLTSRGSDVDPSLSVDRRVIVFVRKTDVRAGFNEPVDPDPVETQIWTVNINDPPNATMVFAGPLVSKGSQYATFAKPKLSPDKQRLYFLIHLAVDEDGLVALDIASGQAAVITEALDYNLVETGNGAGDIVVRKLKAEGGGFSRKYWLMTPTGREPGLVGNSKEAVQRFLNNSKRSLGNSRL
jgi:hypothetical protein